MSGTKSLVADGPQKRKRQTCQRNAWIYASGLLQDMSGEIVLQHSRHNARVALDTKISNFRRHMPTSNLNMCFMSQCFFQV